MPKPPVKRARAKPTQNVLRLKLHEGKLKEAEERIAAIKTKAMSDVGNIAEETTAEIVEQLLGTKADKASVTAAVKASNA